MSGASICRGGGLYARFRYDARVPPTVVLVRLTAAVSDCSGFRTGLNEVRVITSKAPGASLVHGLEPRRAELPEQEAPLIGEQLLRLTLGRSHPMSSLVVDA